LCLSQALSNLHQDTAVKPYLNALCELLLLPIVDVADEGPGVVVDHDASVEGVEAYRAIVPFLGFLVEVARVETAEFMDGGRGLTGSDGQAGSQGWHNHNHSCTRGTSAELKSVSSILAAGGGQDVDLRIKGQRGPGACLGGGETRVK
jgi:hypothetical protein